MLSFYCVFPRIRWVAEGWERGMEGRKMNWQERVVERRKRGKEERKREEQIVN